MLLKKDAIYVDGVMDPVGNTFLLIVIIFTFLVSSASMLLRKDAIYVDGVMDPVDNTFLLIVIIFTKCCYACNYVYSITE